MSASGLAQHGASGVAATGLSSFSPRSLTMSPHVPLSLAAGREAGGNVMDATIWCKSRLAQIYNVSSTTFLAWPITRSARLIKSRPLI